ncbi:hypothetical protein GQ473_00495 [archaeon]|nr:hypothetical protein [archaeon]
MDEDVILMVKRTKRLSKYYVTTKLSTKSRQLDHDDAKMLRTAIKMRNPKAVVNITRA